MKLKKRTNWQFQLFNWFCRLREGAEKSHMLARQNWPWELFWYFESPFLSSSSLAVFFACLGVWLYNIVTVTSHQHLMAEKRYANKKSMIRRIRSHSGYGSVMWCIVSVLISRLWLKSSGQYETKNLPRFICVSVSCVVWVYRIFCFCPLFDSSK